MGDLAHPHDHFFKALMEQPGAAGALLRERLPPAVVALLADEEPELVDGDFIDDDLREQHTDRLYKVRTRKGRAAFVYCLIEHKSAPDPRVGMQLLRYLARVWTRVDTGSGPLPPVVPLVVYHGEHEWRTPTCFGALLEAEEAMRPWLLDFRFGLVDVGAIPDEALSAHEVLRAGLAELKYALRHDDQRQALERILTFLAGVPAEFLRLAFVYMIVTYGPIDRATLREAVRRVMPERESEMTSIALQEWRAEWKAEGKAE